jgi:hypothetical protein
MTLRFCPLCLQYHDPDLPCGDLARQAKRDIGIPETPPRKPSKNFNILVQNASSILIIIALVTIIWVIFMMVKIGY